MNEEVKSEFNQLLNALIDEKGRISELQTIISRKVNAFRAMPPSPSCESKVEEFAGLLGRLKMVIIEIQNQRFSMEATLKELMIIVGE